MGNVDLFETPELLPVKVQDILKEFEDSEATYESCKRLIEMLNIVGYTCDYELDAVPYNLIKS